jgi:type VI secretion system protein
MESDMALLELLTGHYSDGSETDIFSDHEDEYRSITDHLYRLLNARRGAVSHIPDYGLPDLTELYQGLPYSVEILIHEIRCLVEKYEPRLHDVRIDYKPMSYVDCIVHLGISGRTRQNSNVRIETYFYSGGQARVE